MNDTAHWYLPIDVSYTYAIEAWQPDAPEATSWNQSIKYEVVADSQVVASATLNQRMGRDEWNHIADVQLAPGDNPY